MSRTHRRTISWLALATLLGAGAVGLTRLPGYGGVVAEVRWLLARGYTHPDHHLRAAGLIVVAKHESPESHGQIFRALLRDDDPCVVRAALRILEDHLRTLPYARQDLRRAFRTWFREASIEEKICCGPGILTCLMQAEWQVSGDWDFWAKLDDGAGLHALTLLRSEDHRWLVASTLQDIEPARIMAEGLLLGRYCCGPRVSLRLRRLDGLGDPVERLLPEATYRPIGSEELGQQLQIDVDELVAMLNDPIDEVRWAAGRILTVCGDERGLAAFCEWLQTTRGLTREADKLMTDLFGPNWRDACESGGATRQSGASDR